MGSVILAQVSTAGVFVFAIVTFVSGAAVAWVFRSLQAKAKRTSAENEADRLIAEAQNRAQEIVRAGAVEAKATFLQHQEEFDKQTAATRNEIREAEKRLDKREDQIERQVDMLRIKERNIEKTEVQVKEKREETDKKALEVGELLAKQRNELLKVSRLSIDEAKSQLLSRLEQELEQECAEIVAKRINEAQEESEERSREIVVTAIQRYAAPHTADATISTIDILSDEMKGRVIGREGRNIRAFEKATGVDIIVDDTPGVIEVSCFDPVRKEKAVQAMNKLLVDGRIHPTRIEEVVKEVDDNVEKQINELGKKSAMEANVQGLNRKLINLLGRLHFRTSYGQNVLRHSIEVAYLCQVMADELGLNGTLARRCGLLHDIGKAVDRDIEGGHPAIGEDICRRFNERSEVLNAIAGHHGDAPATSPYTPLVAAADAISAARPGSRRESLERYVKRLQQLEDIATSFEGVRLAYAIQAGREVRVIVDANNVDDANAMRIAREVAKKVEAEMQYPGEVKVTVLREVRAVEYAR
ncbi:MAG: ribonuclease Y [Phycisphaerae bacterium]|nr:ribonuclease Y [Phycisphaerae bacterium]